MNRFQLVSKAENYCKSFSYKFANNILGLDKIAKQQFEKYDIDGSGTIDKMECYVMVLSLFLYCAQYVNISQKIIPSQEFVFELFSMLDDGKGELRFEEFKHIFVICVTDIVSRVIIQLSLSILVVPIAGAFLWEVISTQIFLGMLNISNTTYEHFIRQMNLPTSMAEILVAPTLGVLLTCVVINMVLLPFLLDLYQVRLKKNVHMKYI